MRWRWHSCRNQHCPLCQKSARDAWRRAYGAELLYVPSAQIVFTLPQAVLPLARAHPRWVWAYDTLLGSRGYAGTVLRQAALARRPARPHQRRTGLGRQEGGANRGGEIHHAAPAALLPAGFNGALPCTHKTQHLAAAHC